MHQQERIISNNDTGQEHKTEENAQSDEKSLKQTKTKDDHSNIIEQQISIREINLHGTLQVF